MILIIKRYIIKDLEIIIVEHDLHLITGTLLYVSSFNNYNMIAIFLKCKISFMLTCKFYFHSLNNILGTVLYNLLS